VLAHSKPFLGQLTFKIEKFKINIFPTEQKDVTFANIKVRKLIP
jgi:hypothetical protein